MPRKREERTTKVHRSSIADWVDRGVAAGLSISGVERLVLHKLGGYTKAEAERIVRMIQTTRTLTSQERRLKKAVEEAAEALGKLKGGDA